MKTFKHLYPQITAFANLYQAFKNAARGKRKKHDVAAFEYKIGISTAPSVVLGADLTHNVAEDGD